MRNKTTQELQRELDELKENFGDLLDLSKGAYEHGLTAGKNCQNADQLTIILKVIGLMQEIVEAERKKHQESDQWHKRLFYAVLFLTFVVFVGFVSLS